MSYYAQVNPKTGEVERVVVADTAEWCAEHLGGTWVETADPYDPKDTRTYCGPGYGYDEKHPQRFAPKAEAAEIPFDQVVFHRGSIGRAGMIPELHAKVLAYDAAELARLEVEQIERIERDDGTPAG
jgi:hypothetical protein